MKEIAMVGHRAMVIVVLGMWAFFAVVTLAHGIEDGLREHWVQMTLSFFMCAFLVFACMMAIFVIAIDACFRALENRLSANPLPYRKKGLSAGSALWVLIGVGLITLLVLSLIAASRGDFFKFGLGLLGCTITDIISTFGSLTTSSARRIRRFEALISARERRGNSGANAEAH